MDYVEYCKSTYNYVFEDKYNEYLAGRHTQSAKNESERKAQHEAIVVTFQSAFEEYKNTHDATEIWNAIYRAHIFRKINISDMSEIDENVVDTIISAAQSWKKSSGHVFEDYIVRSTREKLADNNIQFLLQREISSMLSEGRINNDAFDQVERIVGDDVFDIYATIEREGKRILFGCLQVKTSIRDRVVRDRGFSIPLMEKGFWSVAVALDGKYLNMPKFEHMVNGGSNQFRENGWHGMYVLSNTEDNDRIYLDRQLDALVEDAIKASEIFLYNRTSLSTQWRVMR